MSSRRPLNAVVTDGKGDPIDPAFLVFPPIEGLITALFFRPLFLELLLAIIELPGIIYIALIKYTPYVQFYDLEFIETSARIPHPLGWGRARTNNYLFFERYIQWYAQDLDG